ncbi:branched chain amino acid aminotransferase, partial [Streptomyces sp. SID11233]|nr:branched chain amino acid aminotransferase [Streptomyces sp. SID11233]
GEASLYLRPFMIATEVGLGVKPANEYLFVVIASPAGAYFSGGVQPVSVWLSEDYVRAVKGGTGAAKTGGNYAASLV